MSGDSNEAERLRAVIDNQTARELELLASIPDNEMDESRRELERFLRRQDEGDLW